MSKQRTRTAAGRRRSAGDNRPSGFGGLSFGRLSFGRLSFGRLPFGYPIVLAAAIATAVPAGPALAQQGRPPQQQSADAPHGEAPQPSRNAPRLPADSTTEHKVEFPGRTLAFRATAGAIPLHDPETGSLQAEIAFVAYVTGEAGRPVTFLFNGGPGAASAYLDIGAVGPWRAPLDNGSPSAAPALVPNAETWLDFTDLVFIDPPLTGYSHIVAGGDAVRRLLSAEGDIDALAEVIREWIEHNGRQNSVKFLAGESYGGFRVPKVAVALNKQGVAARGLVMISPLLDASSFNHFQHNPMSYMADLPSMAATAMETAGPFDRNALREVEAYAAGDYLRDLMRGERDEEAIARMAPRVAAYTGLDPAEVKTLAARIDSGTFMNRLRRARGLVTSIYDPTVTAFDPAPHAAQSFHSDPMVGAIGPRITGAMTALYQGPLKWRVDQPYRLLNMEVARQWDSGRSGASSKEAVSDLRNALAADADLRALVAHGASDLVTPYFRSKLILDQMPVFGSADRLKLAVYGGGHMFYSRDASRRAFRADVQALYRAALGKE
jgi:carboxypeptidase C (cathepsin A)